MMKVSKNKSGFTLVELLAVIVVLAIIMIIAVPAVLESMENARKGSLKVYAQNAIRKTMEKHQADMLTGTNASEKKCYTISDLKMENGGDAYNGYVEYVPATGSASAKYVVTLSDKSHSVSQKTFDELSDIDTALDSTYAAKTSTCPSMYSS